MKRILILPIILSDSRTNLNNGPIISDKRKTSLLLYQKQKMIGYHVIVDIWFYIYFVKWFFFLFDKTLV